MRRRDLILGIGIVVSGCIGSTQTNLQPDVDPSDGYPPLPINMPQESFFNPATLDTIEVNSQTIHLVPIDTVYNWHQRGEARFVDSRSQSQYYSSHILGSVLSPAPSGSGVVDPTKKWPKNDRIVTYCGCPLHLSSLRAASLLDSGFTNVYVLQEGFWEWHDRNLPLSGSAPLIEPPLRFISGKTDPSLSGQTIWIRDLEHGQIEAAVIQSNGEFIFETRFSSVHPGTLFSLKTPTNTIVVPLSDLMNNSIKI